MRRGQKMRTLLLAALALSFACTAAQARVTRIVIDATEPLQMTIT